MRVGYLLPARTVAGREPSSSADLAHDLRHRPRRRWRWLRMTRWFASKVRWCLLVVVLGMAMTACTGGESVENGSATTDATTTTAVTTSSTPGGSAVTFVEFSDHLFGIEGVAPQGWTEVQYGVLLRGEPPADVATLLQQAIPGATAADVVNGLRAQLQLDGPPASIGAMTTDHLSWSLYSFETDIPELGGQLLGGRAAIAESEFGGFIVGILGHPDEVDALAADVFRPVVAAFVPPVRMAPAEPGAIYRDASASIHERVEDLLSRMSLAEKLGQMTQVEKNSITEDAVTLFGIGSVLSGGGGSPGANTPAGWAEMVDGFQAAAMETRLGIPLIYGVDAVHGHNNVRGATVFPHNVGLGAANDPDLMRRIGEITAAEVAATGISWNFAPTVAVPQDIRWGRTYEGYGEDPALVTRLAAAYLEGLQGDDLSDPSHVLATLKHFVGDGGTSWGTATGAGKIDQGDTQIDEATLRTVHLPPYIESIDRGAQAVMISYSSWNGTKVHASRYLITDVLKGELGFGGIVLSDWQAIDQISADYDEAVATAIDAGIDMNMVPYDYARFIWTLWRAVDAGDVSTERIDDAVRRILRVKFELGLFETPFSDPDMLGAVGSAEHRAVAREAVAKSAVLLKNEGDLLPLDGRIEVIFVGGEAADDVGIQSGGWTIEWQGKAGAITPGTTILEGIEASVAPGVEVHYDRFGNLDRVNGVSGTPDVCIGVVGERPYAEFEGDSSDLAITDRDLAVLENLDRFCERIAVVLVTGRPLIITDLVDGWDSLVAAWLPGTEGSGVADVLFGAEPFTGTLSYTWPRSLDQVPLSALSASGDAPLFPRGFGLVTDG